MNNLYRLFTRNFSGKGIFLLRIAAISILLIAGNTVQAQLSIATAGVPVNQNFDGMGTSPTATLPTGFKWCSTTPADWTTGATATTQAAGSSGTGVLTGSSTGGCYNFANGITGSATDRSLGFLNSSSFFSPRSIVLKITNNTGSPIGQLDISFDYEKYRSGKRQYDWTFFHGNTSTPSTAAVAGNQSYAAELNNTTISDPPVTTSKSITLSGLYIPAGSDYYLKWTLTGLSGSSNGKALGIDNFSITATATTPCTPPSPQAQITSITNLFATQLDINYTRGGGSGLMIVATANNAVLSPLPLSGFSYTANSSFGSGTLVGGGNGYVVYNSSNPSGVFTVTGLTPNTTYRFYVFEYFNGPCYLSDGTYLAATTSATSSTNSNDYFLSRNSGDWNNALTWFSSSTSAAGPWTNADIKPTSAARGIQIQSPHIVTLTAAETAALVTIDAGAKLTYTSSGAGFPFTIADVAAAVDFKISGTYELFGTAPTLSGTASAEVYNGGLVRAVSNLTPSTSDNFPQSAQVLFKTGSVFQWDSNISFSTSGVTYFPSSITDIPTFRINGSPSVGGGTATIFNGLLEVNAPVTFYNAGTKTFRNGIIGSGDLTQDDLCGQFIINGATAKLGGTGAINLNNAAGLDINSSSVTTMISDKTVNATLGVETMSLNTSSSLYLDGWVLSGGCRFTLATGCTLRLGSTGGISSAGATGNIQTTGARTFNANCNFIYNGTANQITGNGLPTTINSLTINPSAGITVALTTTNTSVQTFNLTSGLFAIGTGQQMNIFNNGTVTAVAGDFATGTTGGILNFAGVGTFTGICNPYNVYASGPVNFGTGPVTIQNGGSFMINAGGSVSVTGNGPFYSTGSTLVYNTGGAYEVYKEWNTGTTFGARAIPYNVTIQGTGTHFKLNNTTTPTPGIRDIFGNLVVSAGATLSMSTVSGDNLYISGNWTRDATATYNNNARLVNFNGITANQTITVTGGGTETFGYVQVSKATWSLALATNTNMTINGSPTSNIASNTLVLLTGDIDLNNQTLNFNGWNGVSGNQNNIQTDGSGSNNVRNINSSTGQGIFAIFNNFGSGSPTVAIARNGANTAKKLFFSSSVKLTITAIGSGYCGVDFGLSGLTPTPVTTVNGILQINSHGFVNPNAPVYGTGSTLIYNPGGSFDRNVEWGTNVQPGFPYNVIVQNNTNLTLNFPNTNGNADRELSGSLSITSGSTLLLSTTAANKLTIGGNLVLDGTVTLPTVTGGDIHIAGNWTRSATGVFNPNDRAVYFEGSTNSTITASGGETFPYLRITKATGAQSVLLANDVNIGKEISITTGIYNLQNSNTIIKSNATATASVLAVTGTVSYGGGTGNGRFIVERYIPSHAKAWQLLAVPVNKAADPSGQTIYDGWQEAGSNAAGFGTIVTSNVAGAGFDVVGGVGPSMKTYVAGSATWLGVPNTSGTELYNQKGYMIFIRGDRTVTTVAGGPTATTLRSKGKIMEPGNLAPTTTIGSNQFESVGNPFACTIDFSNDLGVVKSANVQKIFYVWDPKAGGAFGYGAYQTCIKNIADANYTITPGGGSYGASGSIQNIIQSGQAFFVRAVAGGGTVSFNETAKTTGSSIVTRPGPGTGNMERKLFSRLYTVTGGTHNLVDGVFNEFDRGLSYTVDMLDALKFTNTGENLGIAVDGQLLAAERRGYIRYRDTIYYNIGQLRIGQVYQFEFEPKNIADITQQPGFLVDQFLGTRTPVSMRQNTLVNFTITNNPASYAAGRFMLVFGKGRPNLFSKLAAEKLLDANQVSWTTTDGNGTGTYEIERSADGVSFTTIHSLDANDNEIYSWKDENPLPGNNYYRVHLLDKGMTAYSNLAKLAAEEGQVSGMKVYPNPVKNGLLGLQFNAALSGNYTLKLYNSTGQVIMNRNFNCTAQPVVKENIKIPGSPAKGLYKLELIFPDGSSKTMPVIID